MPTREAILGDEIDAALARVRLTRDSARFNPQLLGLFGGSWSKTPLFQASHEDPWRTPSLMAAYRDALASSSSLADLLSIQSRWVGRGTRRSLLGPLNAKEIEESKAEGALDAELEALGASNDELAATREVPFEVRRAGALVLAVVRRCEPQIRTAFMGLPDIEAAMSVAKTGVSGMPEGLWEQTVGSQVDLAAAFAAAQDLAAAVQSASELCAEVSPEKRYDFRCSTRLGEVRLSGGADSLISAPVLLSIDTGGDDQVFGASTDSLRNPISVLIDTAGDDRYTSARGQTAARGAVPPGAEEPFGPAGAFFGLSFLADLRGKDLYISSKGGLGSGVFGCGVLWDRSGDDRYESYSDAEGFGRFGLGLLLDEAGDDVYLGYNQVQACGLTLGCGLLVDRAGDDRYLASNDFLDFPSPQSAKHNVSMAQGAGYGLRADYSSGHSLSGGVGVLFDLNGSDYYESSVFGQGVGYWEGLGALIDVAGDDRYRGGWYVQGASAHFGVGYLEDDAGDDSYIATMNMAQGAGHDFGIGCLIDYQGNDTYKAPNLSLGSGNANGFGLFYDLQGADRYASSGLTLGSSSIDTSQSLRADALGLGVFIDRGGIDRYPRNIAWAKNHHVGLQGPFAPNGKVPKQIGIFVDK